MDRLDLQKRFPKLDEWESESLQPTLKQIEKFAKATRTPVGFLFLSEPPEDRVPIPDYRTMVNRIVTRPSANLLDTIYVCQQRQAWYHEYARSSGFNALDFVGSVDLRASVERVAADIREQLSFDLDARHSMRTWEEALRRFISSADASGIMVMCSGIVLNNTHRRLDPEEFRGFALADELAPLVFINGADSKSAQMFTLAHELAHLWLGESALSSVELVNEEEQTIEQWCNAVAAELLVPMQLFESVLRDEPVADALSRLARQFKVSTLVILRRLRDARRLSYAEYFEYYESELQRLRSITRGSGGDFYLSQSTRVSKRFARAIVASTLEGQTLYRDAMKMLGVSKVATLNEMGQRLGITA